MKAARLRLDRISQALLTVFWFVVKVSEADVKGDLDKLVFLSHWWLMLLQWLQAGNHVATERKAGRVWTSLFAFQDPSICLWFVHNKNARNAPFQSIVVTKLWCSDDSFGCFFFQKEVYSFPKNGCSQYPRCVSKLLALDCGLHIP